MSKSTRLSDFFLFNPVAAWVTTIMMTLLGVISLTQLQLRPYPDSKTNDIMLQYNCYGMPSNNVQTEVGDVVQKAIENLPGLIEWTAWSKHGEHKCFLKFDPSIPVIEAITTLKQKLDAATPDLPAKMRPPVIKAISKQAEDQPAICIAIYDSKQKENQKSLSQISSMAKPLLSLINGVASVRIPEADMGQSFEVRLDSLKLARYGLTAAACFHAIEETNYIEPAGDCNLGPQSIPVSASSELKTVQDIGEVIVKSDEKGVIRLRDVTTEIAEKDDSKKSRIRFNGEPCSHIYVHIGSNADILKVGKEVKNQLKVFEKMITNPNVKASIYYDQTETMQDAINKIIESTLHALLLVAIGMALFLGSFRASIPVLITLPVCLLSSFFMMKIFGFSINEMTLTGSNLAIGINIDDSASLLDRSESIMATEKKSSFEAARKTMDEMFSALVGMTLTLASVYLPIIFMSGITGVMFKEFAVTLAGNVVISGVVAFVLTPVLIAWALSHSSHSDVSVNSGSGKWGKIYELLVLIPTLFFKYFKKLEDLYTSSLRFVLRDKYTFTLSCIAFITLSFAVANRNLRQIFAPKRDQSEIRISIQMPQKLDPSAADSLIDNIEDLLSKKPYVLSTASSIYPGERAAIQVRLIPPSKRKKTASEIAKEIEEGELSYLIKNRITVVDTESYSPFEQDSGPTFYLCAHNKEDLPQACKAVVEELTKHFGNSEVRFDRFDGEDALQISPILEAAGKYGVSMAEFRRLVKTGFSGNPPATYITMDGRRVPVAVVRNDETVSIEETIQDLARTPIDTNRRKTKYAAENGQVKVGRIVNIKQTLIDAAYCRYNGVPALGITVNSKTTDGIDLYEKCVEKAESVLPKRGIFIAPGSHIKTLYKERGNYAFVLGIAMVFVYLFMAVLFGSWLQPLIVMLCVFPTVAGALIALCAIKNGSINVWSAMGILTLIGLMTRIGILMVMYFNIGINNLKKEDISKEVIDEISIMAAKGRFRAIMITMFFAILDIIPSIAAGSESFVQIGTVLIGGLSIGTILTIYIIPVACAYTYQEYHRLTSKSSV